MDEPSCVLCGFKSDDLRTLSIDLLPNVLGCVLCFGFLFDDPDPVP